MDPRETQIGKAYYIRVHTSQEQLKFAGTLHPLLEVTKTLNSRGGPESAKREHNVFRDSTPARQSQSHSQAPVHHGYLATHTSSFFALLIENLLF